jgi:hypothetical protein
MDLHAGQIRASSTSVDNVYATRLLRYIRERVVDVTVTVVCRMPAASSARFAKRLNQPRHHRQAPRDASEVAECTHRRGHRLESPW